MAIDLAESIAAAGHESHLMYFKKRKTELKPDPQAVNIHHFPITQAIYRQAFGGLVDLSARISNAFMRKSLFILNGWAGGRAFAKKLEELENRFGRFDKIIFRGFGTFELTWSFRDDRAIYVLENIWHSYSATRLVDRKRGALLLHDRKLVAVSHGVKESVEKAQDTLGFTPKSIRVITNPCPVERIHRLMVEPCSDLPAEPYLLNVARLVPQKNHALLLDAYARSNAKLPLVIVGEGPLRAELEAKAAALGIRDRVNFVGAKTNPYPWMRHAKLFVLSSRFEGLGVVLLEALACGTPIVAVDCPGGVRDVFEGPLQCYLAANSADALAALIDRTLNENGYTVDPQWLNKFRPSNVVEEFVHY